MSIIPVTVIYQLSVVVFDLVGPELSHPAGHEVQLGLVKQLTVGRNNPDLISDKIQHQNTSVISPRNTTMTTS